MKGKRTILINAAVVAGLLIVGILILLVRQNFIKDSSVEVDGYADRELLLPDQRYALPSVEEQVLEPDFVWYIDPEQPLDEKLVEDLTIDLGESLEESFRPRVETRLEELLFD